MLVELVFKEEGYNKHYDIISDKEVAGSILFRESANCISIESISLDLEYQRKGIGKTLISELLKKYSAIYGCSSPCAIGFWKKLGAEFEYDVNEDMVYELLDMGEYPPFCISL